MSKYIVVAGDFVKTGGMDAANFALADYLARVGDQVHLIAFRVDPDLALRPNVTFHRVPRPFGRHVLGGPLLTLAASLHRREPKARVIVNGGNAPIRAVNWVHYVHAAYVPVSALGGVQRLKEAANHRLARVTERLAIRQAPCVIANSDLTRAHVIALMGIEPARVHTVYYGIDPAQFRAASDVERAEFRQKLGWNDRRRVVFIGALGNRRKAFDIVWAAWERVCRQTGWDATLTVVGQGAELEQWRRTSRAAGLGDTVDFLGFRSDVPLILRASDVLVAPARYEAYGLGVQEALCCGLPAIVSAQSGVAERFTGGLRDLLLADSEDAEVLAQKLLLWREREATLRQAALEFGEGLRSRTWDQMAADVRRFSEEVDWD
jgi:glycosyltransferase involved in cell wall biosynthesis